MHEYIYHILKQQESLFFILLFLLDMPNVHSHGNGGIKADRCPTHPGRETTETYVTENIFAVSWKTETDWRFIVLISYNPVIDRHNEIEIQ